MQKNLLLVILFVFGIGGGLGLRLWATGQSAGITGPNQVEVLEDGTVITAAGRHLYVHSASGELLRKVAGSALGSDFYIGPLWAADAETVVLRNDRLMDKTLKTGIRAFARRKEASIVGNDYSGPGILQRCDLASAICQSIGDGHGVFNTRRIFGITMDPDAQRMIVSDTSAWELLELDRVGSIVRQSPTIFRFPNTIKWHADGLWVADTNNHRLARVGTKPDEFGEVLEAIAIPRSAGDDFIWPVAFARPAEDRWYVINANTSFDATRVDVIQSSGSRLKSIALPAGADMLDIETDGERLLIADFKGFAIHAVDIETDTITPFGSSEFLQDMEDLSKDRQWYRTLAWLALGLMGIVFIALLAAHAQSRTSTID